MSTDPVFNTNAGIDLNDILPTAQTVGGDNLKFRSACGTWDECQPGDLYVAIADAESDGHDYSVNAIERGAIGVVGERLSAVSVPQYIVDDSRVAFGKICHSLAGNPSQRMTTVGVTGTAGKTIVAHLIQSILKQVQHSVGLRSSIETCFGDTKEHHSNSSVAEFAHQLSKMVIGGCRAAALEFSGSELARQQVAGIQLDAAVITNVLPTNLDLHGSFDNYKRTLLKSLQLVKPTGFAIVNVDDKQSSYLLNEIQMPALTFGIHNTAEVSAKLLDRNRCFQTFLLTAGNDSVPVRTSIIGKQHIYNCLAAAAVGLMLEIDLPTIVKGLETAIIPGRLERADYGQDFGIWIDSSRSPSQLNSAIAAVSQVCDGKLWCICSTDQSQSAVERSNLGTILEQKTDKPIVTQLASATAIEFESCHQVLDGFSRPAKAHVITNRVKAIHWALEHAESQDVVLISGAGERPLGKNDRHGTMLTDREFASHIFQNQNQLLRPIASRPATFCD